MTDERPKRRPSRNLSACVGYVLVVCMVAQPISLFVLLGHGSWHISLLRQFPWLFIAAIADYAILLLFGWWMMHSWRKVEQKRLKEEWRVEQAKRHAS